MNHSRAVLVILIAITAPLRGLSAGNPVEAGDVEWGRDYSQALADSRKSGKPVLLLFQEIPGCAGCRKFGQEVLTHPLLVEAIETEFVPLLVYNNRPGVDAEILSRYSEPAWNYQVIRFLGSDGADLIARKDRIWTTGGVTRRMVEALEAADRAVPGYLRLLADEGDESSLGSAAFAMDCFWVGEARLGAIEGVVGTEAGWLDGREVTMVRFHRDRIGFDELVRKAAEVDCARKVYARNDTDLAAAKRAGGLSVAPLGNSYRVASRSDQKKQIQRTPFEKLVLTPAQAAKVNAFARTDPKKALEYLSPRQRAKVGVR